MASKVEIKPSLPLLEPSCGQFTVFPKMSIFLICYENLNLNTAPVLLVKLHATVACYPIKPISFDKNFVFRTSKSFDLPTTARTTFADLIIVPADRNFNPRRPEELVLWRVGVRTTPQNKRKHVAPSRVYAVT